MFNIRPLCTQVEMLRCIFARTRGTLVCGTPGHPELDSTKLLPRKLSEFQAIALIRPAC
jgi:hypothetical protein